MSRTIIAAAIGVLLILIIGIWGPAACNKIRSLNDQAKVTRGQGEAFHNSAKDAIETQADVTGNEVASSDLTRTNEEEIRNAKGADTRVDPAVHSAGLRALCRRASSRNNPKCRVFYADPKSLEKSR